LPEPQAGQTPFPQSTSVSVPFLTPSIQEGAWQTLPVQTPLWQSEALPQALLPAHPPHEPPQSTSVSSPFFAPSVHPAATHWPTWHALDRQSPAAAQCFPSAHF
jgi:hypothetical protein